MDITTDINKPLLVFAATFLAIWLIKKWLDYRKLPPGPYGFPIIGYLPYLSKDPHKTFLELGKKYGDIFSVNAGISSLVVINDCETAKQVLNNPATLARPDQFSHFMPGRGGFGASHGPKWQEQRRFCIMVMKDLGMGRGEWERVIHDETVDFIHEIRCWKGKPTDFLESLEYSQSGNNLSLLIGRRLSRDRDSREYKIVIDFINAVMPESAASSLVAHIPIPVLYFMRWIGVKFFSEFYKSVEDFEALLRKEIAKNMASSELNETPNFIRCYLDELKKQERSGKHHYFSIDSLVGHMTSLLLGGIDTTKVSLHWLLLILASRPDVQEKIHKEIDDVAGRDRRIYWDDRNQFPYIMATINEMERWVAITPLHPTRCALEDVNIGGYTIPKGTIIQINDWSIMRDQKYHKDADSFDPGRFLNEQNKVKKIDGFFPFSVGKRNCPGEQVAMMTIFLYLSTIMQKFQVVCPKGKTVILEDKGKGIVRQAVSQELCFLER